MFKLIRKKERKKERIQRERSRKTLRDKKGEK